METATKRSVLARIWEFLYEYDLAESQNPTMQPKIVNEIFDVGCGSKAQLSPVNVDVRIAPQFGQPN
jgi:hypothetical protein